MKRHYQKIFTVMEDYTHVKRVCKYFEVKSLDKFHYFHVQSNTLLLADVFGNFQKMCFQIYQIDPPRFRTVRGKQP